MIVSRESLLGHQSPANGSEGESGMKNPQSPEVAIIRTRLAPPRIGSAPVSREKLLRRLDASRHCKLSLVLGPAGSGKTMLLAQWRKQLQEQGAKVAWYNVGTDDDVTQVGAYIVEALRSAKLDIRTEQLPLFNRSGGKSLSSFLASLIDDLIDCVGEIYLIIDDLHFGTAHNIFHLLDALLDAMPNNVRLVFGSRSRPPLNLLKLQAHDQLAELEFKDLRFDLDETAHFVRAQGLIHLAAEHVRRLHDMSDGWAAGLQLLLFALRKEGQAEQFFKRHASQPKVFQVGALVGYLETNVADYINAEELDFLTSISICRRFNRSLCEAVTGDARAGDFLKKFESEQLFLLPIDTPEVDPWYRFHRLFKDFLQSRLEQRDPAVIQAMHKKAARWFSEHRLRTESLRHGSEAADDELMLELLAGSARRLCREGNFRQLIGWCELIPKAMLRGHLKICLNLAWAQISCGQVDAFQANMEGILQHPVRRDVLLHSEIQLLRAYGCAAVDDTAGMTAIVEAMLHQALPEDSFLLSLVSGLACHGMTYAGRFEESREAVRLFYRHAPAGQTHHQYFLADAVIGSSYLTQGRVRDALTHLRPFKEQIVSAGKVGADAIANTVGTLCDALFQFNLLDDARDLLDFYSEIIGSAALPGGTLSGYRIRAQLQRLAGDAQAAFQTLQRLEELGIGRGLDRLLAWSLYDQFGLTIHAEHPLPRKEILFRLVSLAQKHRDHLQGALAEIPMISAMAAAEDALHREAELSSCLSLIEAAEQLGLRLGREGILVRLGFMRCIARLCSGEQRAPLNEATQLLAKAADLGLLRVIADLGSIAHPLARLLLSRSKSESEADILYIALGEKSAPQELLDASGGNAMQAEPLTAREQDVLELLGRGLSAKSIGRSLDISLTTVKWHLKNVYGKLSAGSREDALTKARHQRIIS
jgi:LuxR family maltose regulon positive regulatory protein